MSKHVILNSVTLAAIAVATMVAMGPTKAVAEYPNDKTVLAVVPFGAGGGTDRSLLIALYASVTGPGGLSAGRAEWCSFGQGHVECGHRPFCRYHRD